jgi:hypothetical protein
MYFFCLVNLKHLLLPSYSTCQSKCVLSIYARCIAIQFHWSSEIIEWSLTFKRMVRTGWCTVMSTQHWYGYVRRRKQSDFLHLPEKAWVDIIAISDTAPANLCRISNQSLSDHLSVSTEAYSWYMKNTLDFWQHGGLQGYTDMATVDGGYMLIDNMTDSADICDIVYRYSNLWPDLWRESITAMTAVTVTFRLGTALFALHFHHFVDLCAYNPRLPVCSILLPIFTRVRFRLFNRYVDRSPSLPLGRNPWA